MNTNTDKNTVNDSCKCEPQKVKLHKTAEELIDKWSEGSRINNFITRRTFKILNAENSQKTDASSFSLPIQARPVAPPQEMYNSTWKNSALNSLQMIYRTKFLDNSPSEIGACLKSTMNSLEVPLLVSCCMKGFKGSLPNIHFFNLYVFMGFLLQKMFAPLIEKGDAVGARKLWEFLEKEIDKCGETSAEKSENDFEKFMGDFIKFTHRRMDQLIKRNRERKTFFDNYKTELKNYLKILCSKCSLKSEQPLDIKTYLRIRMKETHWFSLHLWQKLHCFEVFAEKYIGAGKETELLEQLAMIHIALSCDSLKFSADRKNGVEWNVLFAVNQQLHLDFAQCFKIIPMFLEEVKRAIETEIKRLNNIKDKEFLRWKNTAFRSLIEYINNSIAASVVWGTRVNLEELNKDTTWRASTMS